MPRGARVHHRVQEGEALAHGGRHRYCLRLPSCQHPVSEGGEHRVTPRGGEERHLSDCADLRAPAAARPGPGALPTSVVERGDSHERGDVALVEDAQLGQGRVQGG